MAAEDADGHEVVVPTESLEDRRRLVRIEQAIEMIAAALYTPPLRRAGRKRAFRLLQEVPGEHA